MESLDFHRFLANQTAKKKKKWVVGKKTIGKKVCSVKKVDKNFFF